MQNDRAAAPLDELNTLLLSEPLQTAVRSLSRAR